MTHPPSPAIERFAPRTVHTTVHDDPLSRLVTKCLQPRSILQRHEDQPRGPPLPLHGVGGVEARRPARARPAGVRHAAGGGLLPRQAPRHGLRDDHRSRHDRRRPDDRRPARRLRVGGAHRVLQGEPQAVHILCLGITPDDHEWLQAHADDVEVVAELPARAGDHLRAGAPLLRGRGAAAPAPSPPARAAVRRSGRSATARARASSTTRRRSTSRRTAAPASAAPTTTRASTSAARGRDARRPRRRASSSRTSAPAASSAHGEQGSAAKWAHAAMALAIRALGPRRRHRRARSRRGAADGRARDDRGRRAHRHDRLRPRPRGRPRAAARLAGRGRPAA